MPVRHLSLTAAALTLIVLGGVARPVTAGTLPATAGHAPLVSLRASQSTNWSGYNQGALERRVLGFHGVAGDWVVPVPTQHTPGTAAFSSSWTGIGGGCVDAKCQVTDNTLIQAGTEQDVDASGNASYFAWWEIIPLPGIQVNLPVKGGDHIHVDISEVIHRSEVWRITINNVTTGGHFSITVPYASSYLTAEWIEESPLVVGNLNAPLPNLSTVSFDHATTTTATAPAPAGLSAAEEMQMVNSRGTAILSTPSAPDPDADGFNVCTYTLVCSPPSGS